MEDHGEKGTARVCPKDLSKTKSSLIEMNLFSPPELLYVSVFTETVCAMRDHGEMLLQRTYKLGDGVPGHGGVGDPVLPHRTLCVVPADGEGAGGGIEHAHVPGTGARHCSTNTSD